MQLNATRDAIVQNLKDAGCSPDIISQFITYQNAGETQDALRVLVLHRATLLDELHTNRSKLDCLDYLIHQIRTGKNQ